MSLCGVINCGSIVNSVCGTPVNSLVINNVAPWFELSRCGVVTLNFALGSDPMGSSPPVAFFLPVALDLDLRGGATSSLSSAPVSEARSLSLSPSVDSNSVSELFGYARCCGRLRGCLGCWIEGSRYVHRVVFLGSVSCLFSRRALLAALGLAYRLQSEVLRHLAGLLCRGEVGRGDGAVRERDRWRIEERDLCC